MNVFDVVIWLVLLCGVIVGFKSGVIRRIVSLVGMIVVILISWNLKALVADLLFKIMPFFKFQGITSLNIIIYETIAFVLLLILFGFLLRFILKIAGVLDKIVNMTVVLTLPSKLLGAVVGFIEYYIIAFFLIFVFIQPELATAQMMNESTTANAMIEKTPVLGGMVSNKIDVFKDVYGVISKEIKENEVEKVNYDIMDLALENKFVKIETVEQLVNDKKITINNFAELQNKYKGE